MLEKLSGTFLVIDDDESLRNLLNVILESSGATAISVGTASAALEVVKNSSQNIDAVLLDLNLEPTQGEYVYDALKEISPTLPIFPMSGCYDAEIRERFGDREIAGLITKPFLSAELISTLAEGLESRDEPEKSRERV